MFIIVHDKVGIPIYLISIDANIYDFQKILDDYIRDNKKYSDRESSDFDIDKFKGYIRVMYNINITVVPYYRVNLRDVEDNRL